jgi:gliding motility-associated-like protein
LGIADVDGIANNRGAIVIPSGTSIPPLGHYVIGTSNSSANPASVDFQTNNNTGNYCSAGSFLMANGDGWVGLYDATGSPVDAIYWTVSASEASKITTDSDLDDSPCIPNTVTGCTVVASLMSPKQIYQNFPARINYVGQYTTPNTFSRLPDGGTWTRAVAPSINDATVGNCNGGTCLTPTAIIFTITKTNPSCGNNNGSINVSVTSSGTASYAWSANASTANSSTASNLPSGTYSVTITQTGCSKDTTITLNSNSTLSVTLTNPVNPSCAGNNGSITANLSGGTAPYSVTIDTGGTPFTINVPFAISQTLNNLPAGTISVSVTDNAGCSASTSSALTAPTNCCTFTLGANITQPSCGTANGIIATTTANGSGNYSYTWSANAATGNSATANNLSAAVYALTITDNGFANCFIDTSFTLTNPNAPVVNAVNTTNETCIGSGDGTASISASGGTGTLSYTWSANASTGNSSSASNLTAGTYNFTVTDANNCQATGNANVQSNVCCSLQTSGSSTSTTCGQNNGSATVNTTTAGTLPYNYSINGATAQASNIFSGLASGNYSIVTTDNSGCKDTVTVTIAGSANSLTATATATDASCFGFSDGSASATANGGNPSYSYLWSTGDATSAIQNLPAASYSITVTDNTNCTATSSAIVNQPQALALNIGNDAVVCNGNSVLLDAGSGFSSYSWNNSATSQTISIQVQGLYQVTVTDNNGCTATDGLNISASSGANVDLGSDITIYAGESAGIFATVSGGNTGSFIWSPIDYLSCSNCLNTVASPPVNTLYTLTYTDAIGCISKDSININVLSVGEVFFPTAFSPNGDGNNDIYRAAGSGIKQFRMGIYNRWGEKVFESNNFLDGWDGYYHETPQPMAVYVYTAKVTLLNNQTKEYKGSITLLR